MAQTFAYGFRTSESVKHTAKELVAHLRYEFMKPGESWTQENFSALDSFRGHEKTLKRFHKGNGFEFLWDYVASDDSQGIFLVAESERATRTRDAESFPLKHDFEKLLYVASPLRLMICNAVDALDAQRIALLLSEYSKSCCSSFLSASVFILYCRTPSSQADAVWIWQAEGPPQPMSFGGLDFIDPPSMSANSDRAL